MKRMVVWDRVDNSNEMDIKQTIQAAGPVIEADKLVLKIGSKSILNAIDLTVMPGDFIALLGPNGAGKSTLLKALALLMKINSGSIRIKGMAGSPDNAAICRAVGFLSHGSFLYDRLTAWENLKFYGSLFDVADLPEKINRIVRRVGLYAYLHEPVATFSRGMVQRLSIARALLPDPEILFLDEPYTGLDQEGADMLSGLLDECQGQGKTVLMTTHSFDQPYDFVKRVMILNRGQKIFDAAFSAAGGSALKEIYLQQVSAS